MDDIKQCEWFFSESPKNQDLGPNDAKFEIFKPDIVFFFGGVSD